MDRLDELLSEDDFTVAQQLLGWTLESTVGGKRTAVTVAETEAYAGAEDPASHAYRGKTKRNGVMFGPPGRLYVYRSYGIHWCMNLVVAPVGTAHAVLLRGGLVTAGQDVIEQRRGRSDHLADGPGKLCQALGVTGEHDGADLRKKPIRLLPGPGIGDRAVKSTPHIGITKAADRLWRFVAVG